MSKSRMGATSVVLGACMFKLADRKHRHADCSDRIRPESKISFCCAMTFWEDVRIVVMAYVEESVSMHCNKNTFFCRPAEENSPSAQNVQLHRESVTSSSLRTSVANSLKEYQS